MLDVLGMGDTSAIFHACGTIQLRNEQFKMSVMAGAKISAYIFNTQFGSLSGPFALDILILRNFC
jgi:hypothetical protein